MQAVDASALRGAGQRHTGTSPSPWAAERGHHHRPQRGGPGHHRRRLRHHRSARPAHPERIRTPNAPRRAAELLSPRPRR
ncbi:hypothetical protein [Streptomyces thioluteus]|uniref:hypothetical protein n=1 Tax=Streptomyces thioluteus TaxID=66431 RepID=UPI0031E73112